jgi:hypothetical protein
VSHTWDDPEELDAVGAEWSMVCMACMVNCEFGNWADENKGWGEGAWYEDCSIVGDYVG